MDFVLIPVGLVGIGQIISSFPGVMHGPLYYRHLEKDKSLHLTACKGNFDSKMTLSTDSKEELLWWIKSTNESFSTITHVTHTHLIMTDASKNGWGAEYNGSSSGGLWTQNESRQSIN